MNRVLKITQPNLLSVPANTGRSFDLRHEVVPYFANPWHFHPEIELNFVVSGSGTRFIGQHAGRFGAGEIILLGRNLPHYWKSDPEYDQGGTRLASEAIIARFQDTFAGKDFFSLPETAAIRSLFEKAGDGLLLGEPLRSSVAASMKRLPAADDFRQLLTLLDILQEIAVSPLVETISPGYVSSNLMDRKNKRLNSVMAYLLENFTGGVVLKDVAGLASMNEAAFCRYFRSQTGKTLTQYVGELRVAYACNLLANGEDPVTQVCYQVGFENVSHFIQAFKKLRGLTPLGYRRQMRMEGRQDR